MELEKEYIRNLQEMSAEAVSLVTGKKECSREEAFAIIQEWAEEFTKLYKDHYFDGRYYNRIDKFINKKLSTL